MAEMGAGGGSRVRIGRVAALAVTTALSTGVWAVSAEAAPRVAADIAPVHAIAARVMQGVGEPALVTPPGASPHGYAMRPSEARALADADMVFWIGPDLTPWMAGSVETLAADAAVVTLAEAPGLTLLEQRRDARFPRHDHDHGHGHAEEAHADHGHGEAAAGDHAHGEMGHDDHAHDDHAHDDQAHDEHAHDDHAHEALAHDEHAHDERAHGDHGDDDHGEAAAIDPHLWLDPANAAAMAQAMAAALSEIDPANAATYAANADAAGVEYSALADEIADVLRPVAEAPFMVFHDGYQYFEARFGVTAAGAISLSDAASPGAAGVAEARRTLAESGASCIFAEPQFAPALVTAVAEGSGARSASLDPIGTAHAPGAELYPAMMRDLAAAMAECLGATG